MPLLLLHLDRDFERPSGSPLLLRLMDTPATQQPLRPVQPRRCPGSGLFQPYRRRPGAADTDTALLVTTCQQHIMVWLRVNILR